MNPVELVIGLILVAAVLAVLARALRVPYPSLLVLGGLGLGFVPGLPPVRLPPDVAFLIFIPPLVYVPAARAALRDYRLNQRPILLLSIGLVMFTVVCVTGITRWAVDDFGWYTALVLAAIVGPTDTVAITAVTERLPLPKRINTILEGGSMLNDAVSLVIYKMAITAVVTGTYSLGIGAFTFLWGMIGGIASGLLVGLVAVWVRRRIDDPAVNTAVSLLTGYAAYLGGEVVQASGVLATVAAGVYVGRRLSDILPPEVRVQAFSFWDSLTFLLNGLAFVLLGLQLRIIMADLTEFALTTLIRYAALVSVAVIATRFLWVFTGSLLTRLFGRRLPEEERAPPWRHTFLVAWAGMRGVDSLAAALAVPLVVNDGATAFPHRSLILFLSFGVILATTVLQGMSLPGLIRLLRICPDRRAEEEEALAREAAAAAALRQLGELPIPPDVPREFIDYLRGRYERRIRLYHERRDPGGDGRLDQIIDSAQQILRELLQAERQAVIGLRDQGAISDDVLRRVERTLDYEELRLDT